MRTIALSPSARGQLTRALAECGPLGEDPEPFLAAVFAKMGALPADLITALLKYRADPTETGILQMIAHGMSNKRIAQSLGITPETVKSHAKSIFLKLATRTRAQAVSRAEAIGFL